MISAFKHLDYFLFVLLPYLAFLSLVLVGIYRYKAQTFTYSSLSSQFLENQRHFWGVVPFHYAILAVLAGHLIAVFLPHGLLTWNRVPWRLYLLETTGLILSFVALFGLIILIRRRAGNIYIKIVTSGMDWLLYLLLVLQVASGIYMAIFHRWGSSWFASTLTPYLWSLAKLNPDISHVVGMPFAVKLHIVNAYLLIGLLPFTRLVHILVVPNPYLWRRPQVVRWYGKPRMGSGQRD